VITGSWNSQENEALSPVKTNEILQLVKFRPNLAETEKQELQDLVTEYAGLFVTQHSDLPNIACGSTDSNFFALNPKIIPELEKL
jgi:hypothetical protein